ncbi:MAG TPA: RteC domain-containing protein [Puia sp.]|nr:RteC domain-containing protein [Puia sp.]
MLFQDLSPELTSLYESFEAELHSIQQAAYTPLLWAKHIIDAALTMMGKLRTWFDDHPPASQEVEIFFFNLAELLVLHYLIGRLSRPEVPQGTGSTIVQPARRLKWTGPIKGMGQVIRALVRARAINDGQVTISEVVRQFEVFFDVDLKNIFRATQEDRITKEPGSYLKFLWQILLQEYDEMDQHPRREG